MASLLSYVSNIKISSDSTFTEFDCVWVDQFGVRWDDGDIPPKDAPHLESNLIYLREMDFEPVELIVNPTIASLLIEDLKYYAVPTSDYTPQPDPIPNNNPAVWDLVIKDMRTRDAIGADRYGVRLQAHNGRSSLWDAYEELLDAAVYIRKEIYEREGK